LQAVVSLRRLGFTTWGRLQAGHVGVRCNNMFIMGKKRVHGLPPVSFEKVSFPLSSSIGIHFYLSSILY
jgi:hypothetical protein